MKKEGTLFVKATIHYEKSDEYGFTYFGYYDMKWSSSFNESEAYFISDKVRSKILAILSSSHYCEREAFSLSEDYIYDFSDMETCTISDMTR